MPAFTPLFYFIFVSPCEFFSSSPFLLSLPLLFHLLEGLNSTKVFAAREFVREWKVLESSLFASFDLTLLPPTVFSESEEVAKNHDCTGTRITLYDVIHTLILNVGPTRLECIMNKTAEEVTAADNFGPIWPCLHPYEIMQQPVDLFQQGILISFVFFFFLFFF